MNHCSLQRNAYEEMIGLVSGFDQKNPVVCPKPRRVGILAGCSRPWRLQISQTAEVGDSKAGAELLDIILSKEDYGAGQYSVASSPPYFCGSPPSRAVNPIVHDAHFGDEKVPPLSPLSIPSPSGLSSPSSARKGSCIRTKFGLKPAAVRIEGFDCLNRDRQNSSIPAMA